MFELDTLPLALPSVGSVTLQSFHISTNQLQVKTWYCPSLHLHHIFQTVGGDPTAGTLVAHQPLSLFWFSLRQQPWWWVAVMKCDLTLEILIEILAAWGLLSAASTVQNAQIAQTNVESDETSLSSSFLPSCSVMSQGCWLLQVSWDSHQSCFSCFLSPLTLYLAWSHSPPLTVYLSWQPVISQTGNTCLMNDEELYPPFPSEDEIKSIHDNILKKVRGIWIHSTLDHPCFP